MKIIDAPINDNFDVGIRIQNVTGTKKQCQIIVTGKGQEKIIQKTINPFTNEGVLLSSLVEPGTWAVQVIGDVHAVYRFGQHGSWSDAQPMDTTP